GRADQVLPPAAPVAAGRPRGERARRHLRRGERDPGALSGHRMAGRGVDGGDPGQRDAGPVAGGRLTAGRGPPRPPAPRSPPRPPRPPRPRAPARAGRRTQARTGGGAGRSPAGRTALAELRRMQSRAKVRDSSVVPAWTRLDRAAETMAGLSSRLGGPASSAV